MYQNYLSHYKLHEGSRLQYKVAKQRRLRMMHVLWLLEDDLS